MYITYKYYKSYNKVISVNNLNFGPVSVVVQIKLKIHNTVETQKELRLLCCSFSHVESFFFWRALIKIGIGSKSFYGNTYLFVDGKRKYCDASVLI